jgi:hypothetical protein
MLRKISLASLVLFACLLLATIGLIFGLWPLAYSQGDQDYKAWITVESQDSHLAIKAYCRNNTSENSILRYKLKAQKSGETGRTVSSQSGSVYLPSQSEKCLSQLGLGVSLKDEYEIKLEVYKDGKLVAEDSASYSYVLLLKDRHGPQLIQARGPFSFFEDVDID